MIKLFHNSYWQAKKIPILLLTASWFLFVSTAEAQRVVRELVQSEEQANYDALFAEFGNNKELPEGYELQALLALSYYPELKDVKIKFVQNDVDIAISSRPYWASLLNHAKHRTYLVIIDTERDGPRPSLILKNQTFNTQVGILGHELAHTLYYLDRSFFGIVGDGFCQLSSCRIDFERETDERLIRYGLGWQRFDHSMLLRIEQHGDKEAAFNARGGGGAYMSPRELLEVMESTGIYGDIQSQIGDGLSL